MNTHTIQSCVGTAAAVLTMFSFIPQIIKIKKTRSAKDVSVATMVQLSLGVALWIVYGVMRKDPIIITANVITLVSMAVVMSLYARYARSGG